MEIRSVFWGSHQSVQTDTWAPGPFSPSVSSDYSLQTPVKDCGSFYLFVGHFASQSGQIKVETSPRM